MADILVHTLVADLVSKRIESRRIREGVQKKRSLYNLGAQGPDPLLFFNSFPGSKSTVFKDLGRIMHRQKTGEFLKKGFSKLKNISYDEEWLDLAVYLCGFICHFTVDRIIHPYVYWATQQWIWTCDGTPAKTTHQELEIALDVIYWKDIKKSKAYRTKTRSLVDIGRSWPKGVASYLSEAFKDVYGIETEPKELNRILSVFYRGLDLLYDPKGWKKAFADWIESLTGGGIKAPKKPYPVEPDPAIDWANRRKRSWINPFNEGESHNEAVDDLLLQCEDSAVGHINAVFSRIFNNEDFDDLFYDISYITGLSCNNEQEE